MSDGGQTPSIGRKRSGALGLAPARESILIMVFRVTLGRGR